MSQPCELALAVGASEGVNPAHRAKAGGLGGPGGARLQPHSLLPPRGQADPGLCFLEPLARVHSAPLVWGESRPPHLGQDSLRES